MLLFLFSVSSVFVRCWPTEQSSPASAFLGQKGSGFWVRVHDIGLKVQCVKLDLIYDFHIYI